jgi:hypothetical protein
VSLCRTEESVLVVFLQRLRNGVPMRKDASIVPARCGGGT